MRLELRPVADLSVGEQAAVRTLALAVYPPEVSAAWPGRAIEWAAHQWGVIAWGADGAAVCYTGIILREARWDDRAVKVGGIGGVKTHPATRTRGFATTAIRRTLDFFHEQGDVDFGRRPKGAEVNLLTPPSTVTTIRAGYAPEVHPSAVVLV